MILLKDLLKLISENESIEFEYEPKCPKHADVTCASIAGNCDLGNAKNCHQKLRFYKGNSPFYVDITFVSERNGKEGFIRKTDLAVKHLVARKVIALP